MSPKNRNILVGLTVMGALVGLAGLMLKFGGSTVQFFKGGHQLNVEFRSDRSDGLGEGAQVLYRGFPVGRVTSIRRDKDSRDIVIDAVIDNDPPLPGNVTGSIRTVSIVSGIAAMELEPIGGENAALIGTLIDHQKIPAAYVGVDLIPAEFTEEIKAAGDVIKGINLYVNDPKIHDNFSGSLDNLHSITDNVKHFSDTLGKSSDEITSTLNDAHATIRAAQATVGHLSRQIDDRMLQISKSLDAFESVVSKVNNGGGTAGLLVNDPKLYQSLVDNSRELNATILDLKRLVEQWEQEGLSLKLK